MISGTDLQILEWQRKLMAHEKAVERTKSPDLRAMHVKALEVARERVAYWVAIAERVDIG